jgi:hypothetical protein
MFRSILIIFGRLLKSSKKNNSRVFWPFILLLTLTVLLFNQGQFQKNQDLRENNLSSVLSITSGGERLKKKSDSFVLQTSSGKRKKFNIVFHCRLEKHFPDFNERVV